MSQLSMGLSNLLSQYRARIYSRGQKIDSNQFRFNNQESINNQETIKSVTIFPKEAVIVNLGEKIMDNAVENSTYNNKGVSHQKPPAESPQPPFAPKIRNIIYPENKTNNLEQPIVEKTVSTEIPDFNKFKQSKFEEFKVAWGSKTGSDTYNASYDFDANGKIDMVDYLQFGKEFNSAFEGFKHAWGTTSEQAGFVNQFDYDSDGVIDMADYLQFGKNWLA